MKQLTLSDIRIRAGFQAEAILLIQDAVTRSGLLGQIAAAAFQRQDLEEIEKLSLELKKQIQDTLEPFYERHLGLCLSAECFADPPKTPELYCEVNGCVQRDGRWIPVEKEEDKMLLFLRERKEPAA